MFEEEYLKTLNDNIYLHKLNGKCWIGIWNIHDIWSNLCHKFAQFDSSLPHNLKLDFFDK